MQAINGRKITLALGAIALLVAGVFIGYRFAVSSHLGPHATVAIEDAGISFAGRLDSGATVSSINAIDIEVIGGGAKPQRSDAGKTARFTLINSKGERATVDAVIDQVRGIKTADCRELRYHVYLTVSFNGHTQRVLMNLNDRSGSKDKLLLGRNWLRHGYVVDVSKSNED